MKRNILLILTIAIIFLVSTGNSFAYNVTFIVPGMDPYIVNVDDGDTVTPPDISLPDYSEIGWNDDEGAEINFDAPILKDTTIYGTILRTQPPVPKNYFQVRFHSNGGTEIDDIFVSMGDKITGIDNPQREGYKFAGWFKANGSSWNMEKHTVSEDTVLYAYWSEGNVITFLLMLLITILITIAMVILILNSKGKIKKPLI